MTTVSLGFGPQQNNASNKAVTLSASWGNQPVRFSGGQGTHNGDGDTVEITGGKPENADVPNGLNKEEYAELSWLMELRDAAGALFPGEAFCRQLELFNKMKPQSNK